MFAFESRGLLPLIYLHLSVGFRAAWEVQVYYSRVVVALRFLQQRLTEAVEELLIEAL